MLMLLLLCGASCVYTCQPSLECDYNTCLVSIKSMLAYPSNWHIVQHSHVFSVHMERWYHPDITRNLAEAELQKAEEGVYLMRPRRGGKSIKGFAIDVRYVLKTKNPMISKKGLFVISKRK